MFPEAVWGLICLISIGYLFYGPWQSVCTDFGRQVLFEKRDVVFDLALEGRLEFDSDQYRTIRTSLEQSIRFAHELTLPRFIIFRWCLRFRARSNAQSNLFEAVQGIEDERVRREIAKLVFEAQIALFFMMFAKSPLTVMFAALLAAISSFTSGLGGRMDGWMRSFGETAQIEAEYAPVRPRAQAKYQ